MPSEPLQLFLVVLELTVAFAGVGLLLTIAFSARRRQRWLNTHVLPHWNLTLVEFLLFVALVGISGFLCQSLVYAVFAKVIASSPNKAGLEVFAYGTGMHGGFLIGYLLFPVVRNQLYSEYGQGPAPVRPPPRLGFLDITKYGAGTFLISLPVVAILSLGWSALLRLCGVSDAQQALVEIFLSTKSAPVIVGILFVGCVMAPLSEELVFRASIYRFIRQRLGRTPALLISGCCFGALHTNAAGFLPLAALGMLFAVVYEATGSIRITMIAHALFNLNTFLLLIAGITKDGS